MIGIARWLSACARGLRRMAFGVVFALGLSLVAIGWWTTPISGHDALAWILRELTGALPNRHDEPER